MTQVTPSQQQAQVSTQGVRAWYYAVGCSGRLSKDFEELHPVLPRKEWGGMTAACPTPVLYCMYYYECLQSTMKMKMSLQVMRQE